MSLYPKSFNESQEAQAARSEGFRDGAIAAKTNAQPLIESLSNSMGGLAAVCMEVANNPKLPRALRKRAKKALLQTGIVA